jgi:signal transduction histidine kinase
MYTSFHFDSAADLNEEIIDTIKSTFKSRSITIIVEEDEDLSDEYKVILDERLLENENEGIPAQDITNRISNKYEL